MLALRKISYKVVDNGVGINLTIPISFIFKALILFLLREMLHSSSLSNRTYSFKLISLLLITFFKPLSIDSCQFLSFGINYTINFIRLNQRVYYFVVSI